MTKAELLDVISRKTSLNKTQINSVLDALSWAIQNEVADGGEATLPDIGKFVRVEKAARTGRNPATGKSIEIAAKKVPTFKAAKAFKDIVNK